MHLFDAIVYVYSKCIPFFVTHHKNCIGDFFKSEEYCGLFDHLIFGLFLVSLLYFLSSVLFCTLAYF